MKRKQSGSYTRRTRRRAEVARQVEEEKEEEEEKPQLQEEEKEGKEEVEGSGQEGEHDAEDSGKDATRSEDGNNDGGDESAGAAAGSDEGASTTTMEANDGSEGHDEAGESVGGEDNNGGEETKEEEEAADRSQPTAAPSSDPAVLQQTSTMKADDEDPPTREQADDDQQQRGEQEEDAATAVNGANKVRFGFKPTPVPRLQRKFSFRSLPASVTPAPSLPRVVPPLSSSSSSFFVGTALPPASSSSPSATLLPRIGREVWDEWEWEEDEEGSVGTAALTPSTRVPTAAMSSQSLLAAFNTVRLRRWMKEVDGRQEVRFLDELRLRTEQERERARELKEKDLREREAKEKKEKEEADAAAATTATTAGGNVSGKKKAAGKTVPGKRKGAQTGTATAASATGGKTTKGKASKAKVQKQPKKATKGKGKGSSKKEDSVQTADGVKREYTKEKDEDIDESYLNLWERLRLTRVRSKSDDPSLARYMSYPIDHLTDIKSSLTINLYPNGFSLGGSNLGEQQSVSYPYDSSTKDFIKTIDSLRLPPDFVELLEEVPCVYYDGCLIVEVRDFRGSSTMGITGASFTGAPVIRRVLLQPDTETIVSDVEQICAEHSDWTSDDCLKIEQNIVLATAPPLCLEPDIKVAVVANVLNYNKCKYNLSRTAKKQVLAQHDMRGEKAAVPKKGGVSFALMEFLGKKNFRSSSQSTYDADSLPVSRKPLKDADKNKKVMLPVLSLAHLRTIKKPPYIPKRAVQFHGRDGRNICRLEMRPNSLLNGYEALISESIPPETPHDNPIPFPLGNMREAELFFNQIKTLYAKEGKICLYDSGLTRAIPAQIPNIKAATPTGTGAAIRPTLHQQAAYMSLMRRGANPQAPGGRSPLNPNHPLFQQLASQGGSQIRAAAAAAAAAQAAGQQQGGGFDGRNFLPLSGSAGYSQMPASGGQPGGIPGQSSGSLPSGQMGGLPVSPQTNLSHSGQASSGTSMSGPLTPGSQSAQPSGTQMGSSGSVQSSVGQVGGSVSGMGNMGGGGMGAGQMGGPPMGANAMYPQSGGTAMNPMIATYRRGAGTAAPMRGQPAMRGRTTGGPIPQSQGMGMSGSGVPSPSSMGPPSSPSLTSPSPPTIVGGPMTPNSMSMPSQSMSMAPPMGGMQQPGGISPIGAPMSPTGMMPNQMGSQSMPMQPMPPAGMPQGMSGGGMAAARAQQHPRERKFLLENMQQRK